MATVKKPAAKKATAKPAAKPAAKKTAVKTTAKAAPVKKATAKTNNTALEAALAEIEELKAEVKRLKAELAKAGKSETQKEDKRKSKSKDPFEGLMITVCAGMFNQRSYYPHTEYYYPGGDRRRKQESRQVIDSYCRKVTISKEYQICKYPVTQAQWNAIMGEGFNMSEFRGDDLPVTNISYEEIMLFIEKLNKLTGKKYRLPTEAEWTWAAMGASKDNDQGKYAGCNNDEDLEQYAWYNINSGKKTHPVGQKKPNELGLYDMSGNVWECCSDMLKKVLGNTEVVDPIENSGSYHICRGGSFVFGEAECTAQRSPYKHEYFPISYYGFNSSSSMGFRLAL